MVNYYYGKIFGIQDAAEKETAFKAFIANQVTKATANVEKLIGMYSKAAGFSVGDSLTWADLLIYDIALSLFDKIPDFESNFKQVAAVFANVAKNERVAEYIKNRPVTPF